MSNPAWSGERVFEYESRPYEGIPYLRVHTGEVAIRLQPSDQAPIAQKLKIVKDSVVTTQYAYKRIELLIKNGSLLGIDSFSSLNSQIFFDKSIQKTIKPGVIKAVRDGRISHYGEETGELEVIEFKEGDTFEELIYIGEGSCIYKIHGKTMQTGCLLFDMENKDALKRERPTETQWWIRLVQESKPIGWIKVDENNGPLKVIGTLN